MAGSFSIEPVAAPDPDGGPAWALGTYVTNRGIPCMVYGRLVDGDLGMIDDGGVFHAFEPGGGPIFCYGPGSKRAGLFGDAYSDQLALAIGDPRLCGLSEPSERPCAKDQLRTVRTVIMGPAVTAAAVRGAAGWHSLPVSPRGAFIHVQRGRFSDATMPDLRITARACGPDGRPELLRRYRRARRSGCTITFYLPQTKPARESARSKRNRRARRLSIPIEVTRDDRIVKGGYRLDFRYPITVRDEIREGYGVRMQGPFGEHCRIATDGTGKGFVGGYLNIEGRRGYFGLPPTRNRRRWCAGHYRVQLLFVRRNLIVRNGRAVTATDIKVVGEARFRACGDRHARACS